MLRTLLLLMLLGPATATLAAPKVVTSILPVHSIASSIMDGVAEPEFFIPASISPHHFSLKPSLARTIHGADLVIWVGPGIEGAAHGSLKKLVKQDRQLQLLADQDSTRHRHDHSHDHDHELQHANGIDPHLWLSPEQTIRMATRIAERLTALDPAHAVQYRNNLLTFTRKVARLDEEIDKQLETVRSAGFLVYHDGYRHFADHYRLNHVDSVTVSEHTSPGLKRIRHLRKVIENQAIRCLFIDARTAPPLADSLLQGSQVRMAALDILGADLKAGQETWFILMRNLGTAFYECLQP